MDLIIGPVYSRNLSIVAAYANNYEIPVDITCSVQKQIRLLIIILSCLWQIHPLRWHRKQSQKEQVNIITVILSLSTPIQPILDPDIDSFKSKIFRELSTKIPYEEIKFKEFVFYSRSAFDNDSINRLEHALSDQTKNLVINCF